MRPTLTDDGGRRAVSDALGFVLLFSIIVTGIGVVYVFGVPAVDDLRAHQQTESATTAMQAVAVGLDSIQRGDSSTRSMDIVLDGRTLGVTSGTTLTVSNRSESLLSVDRALVYAADRSSAVAYHGGAVFRRDGDASVLRREPSFRCTDDRVVLTVVEVTGPSRPAVSAGSARIIAERRSVETVLIGDDGNQEVVVTASGTDADGWMSYFDRLEDESAWNYEQGRLRCAAGTGAVRVTRIDLSFVE